MERQAQTASADHRHSRDMVHNVQQLRQAGFDDSQVRALASFVSDMIEETVRPFIKHVDQRFDAVDQRFDAVDQRFDAVDQRFDAVNQRLGDMQQQMNQRVDRVETRLDHLEQHTRRLGEGLAGLDAKVEGLGAKIESGRRWDWVALTVMGLGFVSIVVAILLATGSIG